MGPDKYEMPSKVLITGAAGFIGRALAAHYRQLGYEPLVSLKDGMDLTKAWAVAEGYVANL